MTDRITSDKILFAAEKQKTNQVKKYFKKYLTPKGRFDKIIFAADKAELILEN